MNPLACSGREASCHGKLCDHPCSALPRLGVIGSLIGMLALIAAVLPHWVVPMIYPPPPADQVIVDTGHRIKDRLIAHAKGIEYQAPKPEKSAGRSWSETASAAAISLGLLAILFAVLSLVFREEKLLAAVAGVLGAGAIAVEISFFIIYALIAIAILYVVASIIGLF
ncbi:hypothetical protein [Bradyrhizobium centrolobii]|uniref:hypothetical protein n=1 Tax=Bradyrhizobium centrolobii TaxID=1505087 RepID=UPI001FDA1F34|nr:hypothetical protein [Bradyrhizobium centrolobii]